MIPFGDIFFSFFFFVLLLFAGGLLWVMSSTSQPKYKKAKLLTAAEHEFYLTLIHAAYPEYQVFSQVRLANVVNLDNDVFVWAHFNQLGAKCVDFVLYDAYRAEIALVVELDDRSHLRADRRRRDQFVDAVLKKAGVPILHQKCHTSYDIDEMKKKIRELSIIK
jgi:hypothetical protein